MPADVISVAQIWSAAYHAMAKDAFAGPTAIVSSQNSMASVMTKDVNFYKSLAKGISAYWTSATWMGLGFTGITSVIPDTTAFLESISSSLFTVRNYYDGAAIVADMLVKHARLVTVLVTNVATGIVTPHAVS